MFDENPDADSHFSTVNGELDFVFQPDLAADMRFKTFNGEVWTDFESEPLPQRPARQTSSRGRWVLRTDGWRGVRVDGGGPQLSFETLNGDILIRNARR